jgi:hypothetical protein
MFDASTQPSDAAAKMAPPQRMTGRRPYRSDSGPIITCNTAVTAMEPAMETLTGA